MNQNIIFIAIGILVAFLLSWMVWLEVRLKKIFRGRHTKDLESLLTEIAKDISEIRKRLLQEDADIRGLEKEMQQSMRHAGIVRFNAFQEAGGNQSFTFAALDDNKNGVVISSIHNRETNRVYAKPIVAAESAYQLTPEEKEAISRALARKTQSPK